MSSQTFSRAHHEIEHGGMLAQGDPELIWGWKTPAGQLRAKRRAQLITSGADLRPGKFVLEIGCGTGMFTEMFAQSGATIIAVDISPALLNMARTRGLPEARVQFLEKRFEDCELQGPFDAVIGSSVLHHLEIKSALDKIHRMLKPGGLLCFAEPNMLNPQVFLERKFSRVQTLFWYVSPDETAFVRWQLQKLLLETGFMDIDIIPFDWLHPATPPALINLVNEIGGYLEKTPIMRELAGSLHIRCSRPL